MKKMFSLGFILVLALTLSSCQTAPYRHAAKDSVYAVFGDCYAAGAKAMPLSNSFASLTASDLDDIYPHITLINSGQGGGTIDSCSGAVAQDLVKIAQANKGPMDRAVLVVGIADLQTSCACIVCDKPPTYDQGMVCAESYKKKMQTYIDAILKFNPKCQLVLCTIPDPNNGGKGTCKPMKPAGILQQFNQDIRDLADKNHLKVADVYGAFMGHTEYFEQGDVHPNNAGHAVIASLVDAQFDVLPPTKTVK
jgi:lysophospholipase L1-like esterase